MNILVVHNAYRLRGGEDSVVESEVRMLRANGHEVRLLQRHNDDVQERAPLGAAVDTFWSRRTVAELEAIAREFAPRIIHVHNTFPLVSPSVYWAAADLGIPIVQTLHNFRLLCAQGTFLRAGQICEDCLGTLPWRGVLRKCYRGSAPQSAVLVGMLALHRGIGTWQSKVDRFIALNEFCKEKFVRGGLPPERIAVKPNFVDCAPFVDDAPRDGMLFVGRFSEEKGVEPLVAAARLLDGPRLKMAGAGPLEGLLAGVNAITPLGSLPSESVFQQMRSSAALVVPSICYESFPRTIVEAYGNALPVIATRVGALAELVEDGVTGLLVDPGDPAALARAMTWAHDHPSEMRRMGAQARCRYDERYTAQQNCVQLMKIYDEAAAQAAAQRVGKA
jgi:glycosyltransferase involved in cell wall biosynthesis